MFYKIIRSVDDAPVDVQNVHSLIQLSDNHLEGFKPVIEGEKPEERDGYYVASDYRIINGEVYKLYRLEEIVEEPMEGEIENV